MSNNTNNKLYAKFNLDLSIWQTRMITSPQMNKSLLPNLSTMGEERKKEARLNVREY